MKRFKEIFLIIAVTGLLVSCAKSNPLGYESTKEAGKENPPETVWVTLPFEATMTGTYVSQYPDPSCGDCPVDEEGNPVGPECWWTVINEGEGTATYMGKITHHFEFCVDLLSGRYPGDVKEPVGYFEAAGGDKLYIMSYGQVLMGRTEDHPEHVNQYWRDPFVISGGTGRFEGATGSGHTDDYNSDLDDFSHHHWTGTITLHADQGKEVLIPSI